MTNELQSFDPDSRSGPELETGPAVPFCQFNNNTRKRTSRNSENPHEEDYIEQNHKYLM